MTIKIGALTIYDPWQCWGFFIDILTKESYNRINYLEKIMQTLQAINFDTLTTNEAWELYDSLGFTNLPRKSSEALTEVLSRDPKVQMTKSVNGFTIQISDCCLSHFFRVPQIDNIWHSYFQIVIDKDLDIWTELDCTPLISETFRFGKNMDYQINLETFEIFKLCDQFSTPKGLVDMWTFEELCKLKGIEKLNMTESRRYARGLSAAVKNDPSVVTGYKTVTKPGNKKPQYYKVKSYSIEALSAFDTDVLSGLN